MRAFLLVSGLLGGVLAAAFILMGNEGGGKPGPLALSSYMEDVNIVNKKTGRKQWSLKAERVDLAEDNSIARMREVAIDLPQEGMRVKAASGVFNVDTGDLSLSGNVEARTEDFVISTDHVGLDSEKEEVLTDGKVVMEGKRYKVEGYGMRAFDEKVWLGRDVEAVFF
jgi:LPS export ABC transporter protein LptC